MRLLAIRHGPEEDREVFAATGRPDDERPLTKAGRRRVRRLARALERRLPAPTLVAASPLPPAEETAAIVADVTGAAKPVALEALAPGSYPELLLSWLQEQPPDALVAIVGHEPELGQLVTWLLSGQSHPFLRLRKAGACLLEFTGGVGPGSCELVWSLTPDLLS